MRKIEIRPTLFLIASIAILALAWIGIGAVLGWIEEEEPKEIYYRDAWIYEHTRQEIRIIQRGSEKYRVTAECPLTVIKHEHR